MAGDVFAGICSLCKIKSNRCVLSMEIPSRNSARVENGVR